MIATELGMVIVGSLLKHEIILFDRQSISILFLTEKYVGVPSIIKLSHPLNALLPMLVTELGMVIFRNDSQSAKAPSPMLVTESGMAICRNEEQFEKALFPMLETELGMEICFKNLQK